jgi:hypothetical protein
VAIGVVGAIGVEVEVKNDDIPSIEAAEVGHLGIEANQGSFPGGATPKVTKEGANFAVEAVGLGDGVVEFGQF